MIELRTREPGRRRVRRLPGGPPPGPLPEALSLLFHHAAPLDPVGVRVLSRAVGGVDPPQPVTAVAERLAVDPAAAAALLGRAQALARRVGAPAALPAALRVLTERPLTTVAAAREELRRSPAVGAGWHPGSVRCAARLFGLRPGFHVIPTPGPDPGAGGNLGSGVVSVRPPQRLAAAVAAAAGAVTGTGIGTVDAAAERLGVAPEVAGALVAGVPGFVLAGWHLWAVPARRDRGLALAVGRTLAAGPMPLVDLHAGVRTALRHSAVPVPPPALLRRWLVTQPDYVLDGDTVSLAAGAAGRPTRTDRVLLDALHPGGDDVSSRDLLAALHAAGLKGRGAAHLLRISPVAKRTRPGRYRRRGAACAS